MKNSSLNIEESIGDNAVHIFFFKCFIDAFYFSNPIRQTENTMKNNPREATTSEQTFNKKFAGHKLYQNAV